MFSIVPGCRDPANKVEILNGMKLVNNARQFGVKSAASLVPTSSWILPLDGNSFITRESLTLILRGFFMGDKTLQYNFHAITMFRVLSCQGKLMNDQFSLLDHLYSVNSKDFDTQPVISEYLTKKDEGQIAVSMSEKSLFELFRNDAVYGRNDKRNLVDALRKENKIPWPRCSIENWNGQISLNGTIEDIKNCGYIMRLQYWPEKICEVTEGGLNGPKRNNLIDGIKKRPEIDVKVREKLRQESIKKIQITPEQR